MRVRNFVLLVLARMFPFVLPLLAQAPHPPAPVVRFGVVMEPALSQLRWKWRDEKPEKAFCVTGYSPGASDYRPGAANRDPIARVFNVQEVKNAPADMNGVDFECPPGEAELHTHRPSQFGYAECDPSRADVEKLARRRDPFAVIQCDRRAFIFYYPDSAR